MRLESLPPMMTRSLIAALPKMLSDFRATEEAAPPAHAAPASAAAPATSVQMLVTIGAAATAVERRRQMAKRAERGLASLNELHVAQLCGTTTPSRLREIAAWSASLDMPEDPTLAAIQAEIDLRVRVELAKFDVEA